MLKVMMLYLSAVGLYQGLFPVGFRSRLRYDPSIAQRHRKSNTEQTEVKTEFSTSLTVVDKKIKNVVIFTT